MNQRIVFSDIKKEDFPNTDPSPIEAIPTVFSQTDENKISNSEENEKQGKKKKRNNKNRQKTSKEKPDQKIVDKPSSSLTEDNADRVAVPPVDQVSVTTEVPNPFESNRIPTFEKVINTSLLERFVNLFFQISVTF